MKRFLILFLALASILLMLTGCSEKTTESSENHFDYVIVEFPGGDVRTIEIDRWGVRGNDVLQVIGKDGNVYLFSSANAVLVREGE